MSIRNQYVNIAGTICLLGMILSAPTLWADDVPAAINYQGELADNLGVALTSGYYHIEFRVWDSPTESGAANLIWGRMFPLHIMQGGIFNILLTDDGGEVTDPTPQTNDLREAFGSEDRYLGLTIVRTPSGDVTSPVEINPRQRLVSAPYAFHAQHATAAIEADYATDASNAQHAVDSDNLGAMPAADYMLHSRFPGGQNPATLVTWDGTNAFGIDAHVDGTALVADYQMQANGFITTNGVITPSAGPGVEQGIEYPPNPGGGASDRAWIKYSAITNEDCTLEIGIENDTEDTLALHSAGSITLNAGSNVVIQGKVKAFGSLTQVSVLEEHETYSDSPDRDCFFIVFITAAKITVTIEGISFDIRAVRDDDWNEGTYMYPVAQGEAFSIYYEENFSGTSHVYIYKRPVGR